MTKKCNIYLVKWSFIFLFFIDFDGKVGPRFVFLINGNDD